MSVCPFKQFKHLFGVPTKGIHQYRLLDVAIFDYLMTILLAFLISYLTGIPVVISTILTFILGIVLHILFGVATSSSRWLGLQC